jgi:predicted nuclease with TOPRIM domain
MHIDPAWLALVGTIFGGVGLKLLEIWLGRSKVRVDEAANIRSELRVEIASLREEVKSLENEVDKWREDYYDLRDKYATLNTEYLIALEKIKAEADEATRKATPKIDPPRGV